MIYRARGALLHNAQRQILLECACFFIEYFPLFNSSGRLLAALAVMVLIWAYSWIVMKQMMAYAGPFEFAALRYLGGALVLFVVLAALRQPLAPPPFWPTLLVGLGQTTGFQALAQLALVTGGAGKVSLFCYTMPFWVVLFAWFALSEKPTVKQWFGIALAAFGLVLVIEPWQGLSSMESTLLAIGGGAAWGAGTVLSKWMFQRYSIQPLSFTAWQMLLGSLALCAVAWAIPSEPIVWSTEFILGLAYSVFLASSLAWLIWSQLVRTLPTSVVGLASLLVPLTAILMAWMLLAEQPSLIEGMGIAVIMTGLFVVRPQTKTKAKT